MCEERISHGDTERTTGVPAGISLVGSSPPLEVRPGHITFAPDRTKGIAPLSARTHCIAFGI